MPRPNVPSLRRPIMEVAQSLGLDPSMVEPYGHDKAKVRLEALEQARLEREPGRLILVSAITPTPAGEGKTTTSIGMAQGMARLGAKPVLALRQPSMGPVFGRKGGATGGGRSTVEPAEAINLQFTGDFHAISAAHNLLAAVIDNQLHFGQTELDPRRVTWKRCLDVNDRALRRIVTGLGGPLQGVPRESGFDITAASEVMAIFSLAESREDLKARLDRILIGFTAGGEPVAARQTRATGAMAAILNEAIQPNLVQTGEGVPAFIHGGPFANIAHGCNSVLATRMALATGEYALTEAGFAFDLGAEKFFDIKCRATGLNPAAVVIVATIRALKMHGGKSRRELTTPDPAAVERGLENLAAHLDATAAFGKPVVVGVNLRAEDEPDELKPITAFCRSRGVPCEAADVFGRGGEGGEALGRAVIEAAKTPLTPLKTLYALTDTYPEKLNRIAQTMYGADGIMITPGAQAKLDHATRSGFDHLPICMAKTQDSLSDNPRLRGRPRGFTITIRDIEIAAGAGFIVALTGEIVRMPGLPRKPSAENIGVDSEGRIFGV